MLSEIYTHRTLMDKAAVGFLSLSVCFQQYSFVVDCLAVQMSSLIPPLLCAVPVSPLQSFKTATIYFLPSLCAPPSVQQQRILGLWLWVASFLRKTSHSRCARFGFWPSCHCERNARLFLLTHLVETGRAEAQSSSKQNTLPNTWNPTLAVPGGPGGPLPARYFFKILQFSGKF